MRFLYKILLGVILFNACLILFAPIFPLSIEGDKAVDVTEELEGYGEFSNPADLFGIVDIGAGLTVFGVAIIIGYVTKNLPMFIGIGAFMSIFTSLWLVAGDVMVEITRYDYVGELFTIVTLCLGIIAVITMGEILTGGGGGSN